jgi:uncharacterized membrane protein YgcG
LVRRFRSLLFFAGIIALIVWGVNSCDDRKYPRPSNLYYVNDYAEVLAPGLIDAIVFYGENMYEETKGEGDGRSQIVVGTFLVENDLEIAEFDKTELYREWEIGENDMGILILIFFRNVQYEGYTMPEIREVQIEIGYLMEQYVTAGEAGTIVDTTLLTYDEWDYDIGIMHMYLELCATVYRDAYPDVFYEFEYDVAEHREYIETHTGGSSSDASLPMTLVLYLLSPNIPIASKLVYLLFGALFLVVGGGVVYNVGGGGSSGGAGIFRRRR